MKYVYVGTGSVNNTTGYTCPAYSSTSGAKYVSGLVSAGFGTSTLTPAGVGGVNAPSDQVLGWSYFSSRQARWEPLGYSNGKDIIFCHGMQGDIGSTFLATTGHYAFIKHLVDDHGYTVWICDTGRMSNANALACVSIDLLYAQIVAYRGGSPKVVMMGHSMGTALCLTYARLKPSRVSACVLFSAYNDIESAHGSLDYTVSYSVTGDPNAAAYPSNVAPQSWHLEGAYLVDNHYSLPATYPNTNGTGSYDTSAWTTMVGQHWMDASRNPTAWSTLDIPIYMVHSLYDSTIPHQAAQWWQGVVNPAAVSAGHSAPITFRSPFVLYPGTTGTPVATVWGTGNVYTANQSVVYDVNDFNNAYLCIATHTSSSSVGFQRPSTPNYGKWTRIAGHDVSTWGYIDNGYTAPLGLSDIDILTNKGFARGEVAEWLRSNGA